MDYVNEIGKILLTSPLIMAGVQIIKALWKDYDPKWIPYLSIATGICAFYVKIDRLTLAGSNIYKTVKVHGIRIWLFCRFLIFYID